MFQLTQSIVVDLTTGFQPIEHELLLGCVGIDSVSKIDRQHNSPVTQAEGKLPIFSGLTEQNWLGGLIAPQTLSNVKRSPASEFLSGDREGSDRTKLPLAANNRS